MPNQYRDHALLGNWQGRRECHIKNDTLLIYKLLPEERAIRFERIGSHSEVLNI
ncbi:hypothetical protein PRO82_000359 [Candidatus Protochlamydia amoebophila]|uniref:type II toxin-antitoxin system YafQ family toxin n=1 Tax=Candidatus Protochlamydia amoebophila TaxID=362787 RepID=UPI001BD88E47|nr:type II toxin-antitoxin system YafQ family toxin [Candidatus Protochlamydia amoebophila]MBS4163070.1 hypothetical protein [Candidatus Protochlamydia amoebophila]